MGQQAALTSATLRDRSIGVRHPIAFWMQSFRNLEIWILEIEKFGF